jgi:hypothetical protein
VNTGEAVETLRPLCHAYDTAPDMETRIALGDRLDAVAGQLSEKQAMQVVKLLQRG